MTSYRHSVIHITALLAGIRTFPPLQLSLVARTTLDLYNLMDLMGRGYLLTTVHGGTRTLNIQTS